VVHPSCTFLCALFCSYLQSFSKINITAACCGFKKSEIDSSGSKNNYGNFRDNSVSQCQQIIIPSPTKLWRDIVTYRQEVHCAIFFPIKHCEVP
jgi:hypothetical protein